MGRPDCIFGKLRESRGTQGRGLLCFSTTACCYILCSVAERWPGPLH